MTGHESLRNALIERCFDVDEDNHETITDEQILARIEDLVGQGWHAAGHEADGRDYAKSLLTKAFSYVRFLSIGSVHNTVEVRVSRDLHDEIRALVGPATSVGSDG